MYLSKLELNIASPSVRQALWNCQDMHRNLMRAFDGNRSDVQMLYRVVKDDYRICVYVQSMGEPQWERIAKNGYQCTQMRDISALLDLFTENALFRFSVLACPAKKVRGDGKNSRRVLLRRWEERENWLKRQGERNGFTLLEAHESANEERLYGKKRDSKFYLAGVPFEGILEITDSDAFRRGFTAGIGAEKAYGFGLLMVGRA